MELASVNTPATALLAGLVTSFHCAVMCGPLACWLAPTRPAEDATSIAASYQISRLASYTFIGATAGALGQLPLSFLNTDTLRFLPWTLVLFFLAVALRWDKRLPRFASLTRLTLALQNRARGRSRLVSASLLGAATPLLPCGPLYFLIALSTLSGSALRGAEFMLSFGLGTLPLLWLVQSNFGWIRAKLPPVAIPRIQTALAFAAALVIGWRLRGTLGFDGPSLGNWVCF